MLLHTNIKDTNKYLYYIELVGDMVETISQMNELQINIYHRLLKTPKENRKDRKLLLKMAVELETKIEKIENDLGNLKKEYSVL